MMDSPGRYAYDLLPVGGQQRDHQRSPANVEVNRPGHRPAFAQCEDITDEVEQRGLIVGHPSRQFPLAVGVNHHAVMLDFDCVCTGLQVRHGHLRSRCVRLPQQTTSPTCPDQATLLHISMSKPEVS